MIKYYKDKMSLLIKKFIEISGIFLIILLLLFFVFLYFETKKVERLMREIEETTFSIQVNSKEPLVSEPTLSPQENKTPFVEEAPILPAPEQEFVPPESKLNSKQVVHLPILMYHHIDFLAPGASKVWQDLTVSPQTFERQMKYLFEQNYHPITFRQFFDFIEKGNELPEKSLIITFDDGWKNQYTYALPVLKKYKFPATFFIVVNQTGGNLFMNWEELKDLLNNGMEIGSHTITHPNLRRVAPSQLIYEIKNSKTILEKNLDYQIEVFAYPYGIFDSKIIEAVSKANYKMARTTIWGLDQNMENLYTLRAVQVYDGLDQLKRIFPPVKQ